MIEQLKATFHNNKHEAAKAGQVGVHDDYMNLLDCLNEPNPRESMVHLSEMFPSSTAIREGICLYDEAVRLYSEGATLHN